MRGSVIYDNACYKMNVKIINDACLGNLLANIIMSSNAIQPYKSPASNSSSIILKKATADLQCTLPIKLYHISSQVIFVYFICPRIQKHLGFDVLNALAFAQMYNMESTRSLNLLTL